MVNIFFADYRIAGHSREKFRGFVAIREGFLCEIWGRGIFGVAKASNLRKFSPRKLQFAKVFSLESKKKILVSEPDHG